MPEPTPRYYEITAPGNNDIRNLTKLGHNFGGPQALEVTQWDFGTALGNEWAVKRLVLGYDGSTADNMTFWLHDHISDVAGVGNAENFFDGDGNWAFRMRVSKTYISSFSSAQILDTPWVDIGYGVNTSSPTDLKALILSQTTQGSSTGGNDNTGSVLVQSLNYSNLFLTNVYVYIAVRPDLTALPGQHSNWGFRQKYVYP
jgi:hypothetical protein